MAHIGEKLRFRDIGGFGRLFCLAQGALGENLCGDVARRAAVAQEPAGRIEDRVAADRDDVGGLAADLLRVGEAAERFVAVERGQVLPPFGGVGGGVASQLGAAAADASRRFLAECPDALRDVGEAVVLVAFPKPVR